MADNKKFLDKVGLSFLISEIKSLLNGKAPVSHNHSASNITSGTLSSDRLPTVPVSKGGTGATTAAAARTNLGAAASSHTHSYAGSASAGGSANSAVKLDSSAGSATQPVYFSGGKPVATTHTLGKSVPSNAVFTDTTYSDMTGASSSAAGTHGLVPAPAAGAATRYLRSDGTWQVPPDTDTKYTALKNPYAITLQGNGTTLANGVYDGSAAKTVNITADGVGAADKSLSNVGNASFVSKAAASKVAYPIVTTAGTGSAYTATVEGLTELYNGLELTIIPHTVSTSTGPTLNVNGLGAKPLRQMVSINTGTAAAGASNGWITSGKPIKVMYNDSMWVVCVTRPSATELYGTVSIASGGTGATTAAKALTNLGAAPASHTQAISTISDVNISESDPSGTAHKVWIQPLSLGDYLSKLGISNGTNYLKIGDVKICWGTATTSSSADPAGVYSVKVTLPITMSSDSYTKVVTRHNSSGSSSKDEPAYSYYETTTSYFWIGSGLPSITVFWIAIGI